MHSEPSQGSTKFRKLMAGGFKTIGISFVAVVIFFTGIGVGSGSIKFGQSNNSQNKDLPKDLDYSSVEQIYDSLKVNFDGDLDESRLLDGIKAGLVEASGDPYTVFLNAKEAEEFNNQLSGTFSGIGAELGQDADKNIIVVAPISGFPASKAGLRSQDIIAEVDGKSTVGMSILEAVAKIRGPKDTEVELRVIRDKKEELSFKIKREDIKVPSVKYEVLSGNIGYMQINQFNEDTSSISEQAAKEFVDKGVKGILVDLRGNPGGLVDSAVDVTSLWLPKGSTILEEKRGGKELVSVEKASGNNLLDGVPTVVLIDAGSASASEIMAGALKDHGVAKLFGVKSFGKGSVQQVEDFSGTILKITFARWYRPNGDNIDKKGIKPDTEVQMSEEDYSNNRDPQKDAALELLRR